MTESDDIAVGVTHVHGERRLSLDRDSSLNQVIFDRDAVGRVDGERKTMQTRRGIDTTRKSPLPELDGEESLPHPDPDRSLGPSFVLPSPHDRQAENANIECFSAIEIGDDDGEMVNRSSLHARERTKGEARGQRNTTSARARFALPAERCESLATSYSALRCRRS